MNVTLKVEHPLLEVIVRGGVPDDGWNLIPSGWERLWFSVAHVVDFANECDSLVPLARVGERASSDEVLPDRAELRLGPRCGLVRADPSTTDLSVVFDLLEECA